MTPEFKIQPSLLAADFGRLREEAQRAEASGADALHIDIMDGHFVPNLSMGPDVVQMAKDAVRIPLSVHLMLSNPHAHIEKFAAAGADILLIHVEAPCDVAGSLRRIRELGVRPGITLNPDTPAGAAEPFLDLVGDVLCMTVYPGYGGQSFMARVLPKVREVRQAALARRFEIDLSVDGGIGLDSAAQCAAAGANVFVAGTSLYRADDMDRRIGRMREGARAQYLEAWSPGL